MAMMGTMDLLALQAKEVQQDRRARRASAVLPVMQVPVTCPFSSIRRRAERACVDSESRLFRQSDA